MINDEEFKQIMCDHMKQQTEFLATISTVAKLYEDNWKVIKGIWKVGKWVVTAFLTYIGVTQGVKAIFPK